MTGTDLALLLGEANRASWNSLASALGLADGQPSPRVGALVQHVSVSKRGYWEAVSVVLGLPDVPPELNLDGVCLWEVQRAAALSPEQLETTLDHSGTRLSVAELLRLNARHTVWYAGQIAALCSRPRLA